MPSSLLFAAFVFWLLAVPMDGPLPAALGIAEATRLFLLPHVIALLLIGGFCPPRLFSRLAPAGISLSAFFTLMLPLRPEAAPILFVALSLSAAFTAIESGRQLHRGKNPVLSAALGLVTANLLLFALHHLPGSSMVHAACAALPLLLLCPGSAQPTPTGDQPTVMLGHFLPFVLVFHIVGGLMYSFLYPAYQPVAWTIGAELPFYMGTALGGVWLVRKHRDLILIFGIVLGMAAFALLQRQTPLTINLSMYAMQAGQGFVDLFLLAYLLSFRQPIRAFGLGMAILCLGILGGQLIARHLQELVGAIAVAGHIALNLSVLVLYYLGRRQEGCSRNSAFLPRPEKVESSLTPAETACVPPFPTPHPPALQAAPRQHMPENLRLLLSERECLVLTRSLDGRTYREIATDLDISESSVKTYMKRICDKLGVQGRKGLFDALERKSS